VIKRKLGNLHSIMHLMHAIGVHPPTAVPTLMTPANIINHQPDYCHIQLLRVCPFNQPSTCCNVLSLVLRYQVLEAVNTVMKDVLSNQKAPDKLKAQVTHGLNQASTQQMAELVHCSTYRQ